MKAWLLSRPPIVRLACRLFGHVEMEIIKQHVNGEMLVANGCARCGHGVVVSYGGQFPRRR